MMINRLISSQRFGYLCKTCDAYILFICLIGNLMPSESESDVLNVILISKLFIFIQRRILIFFGMAENFDVPAQNGSYFACVMLLKCHKTVHRYRYLLSSSVSSFYHFDLDIWFRV